MSELHLMALSIDQLRSSLLVRGLIWQCHLVTIFKPIFVSQVLENDVFQDLIVGDAEQRFCI